MRHVFWLLIPALLLGGCRAQILQSDQMEIRQSLLAMYQDEVMDNLIRTKLRLPVIQVDYRTMTGTVSSLTKANGSYTREGDTNLFSTGGSAVTPIHVLKSTPFFGGEQDQTTQLTLTGEPVCDDSVYEAYEQYLFGPAPKKRTAETRPSSVSPTTVPVKPDEKEVGSDVSLAQPQPSNATYTVNLQTPSHPSPPPDPVPQGELLVSDNKPADGTYHIAKAFDGKWYYIPLDSAEAFFKLYKRVVLARKANPTGSQNLGDELQLFRLNQLQ